MISWQEDDGVVILIMDDPGSSVNTMNERYAADMAATVDRLEAEQENIRGVILTSAKRTFFAGGDLQMLRSATPETAGELSEFINKIKADLRRLEKLGRPVVAAINGSALGGGLEIALAAHHRIAADVPGCQIGLPEITLGLLPGAGGITRTVRMLGLQRALTTVIMTGTRFRPKQALEAGLVDEVVGSVEELIGRAKEWIDTDPDPAQPWDVEGFTIPGGAPNSPAIAAMLPAMPATIRQQVKGSPQPAPRAALAAAVEGALLDVDTALAVETRYLINLTTGPVAKNMITTMFFGMQKINSGASRPDGFAKHEVKKVGILGAGMMGAAIAYVTAKAGIDVVIKDLTLEAARKGKGYAEKIEEKALSRGTTTPETSEALLARITPTGDARDFAGVDLVIEAVFESVEVKKQVFGEIEAIVEPDAVLGSNTSTLPISLLAKGVQRSTDFIGIHFFSPVDKMPLVEIVRGEETSDEVLAKVFDFVQQIRKTPIVVNDGRGFFTSRVIMRFIDEAVAAVGEGVTPSTVEQAALQAGYPAGALQLTDELTLTLTRNIRDETKAAVLAEGGEWVTHPAEAVIDSMMDDHGRAGRSSGAGFYEYNELGRRTGLWSGLADAYGRGTELPFVDLQDRMLFAEAIETVRCLDDGVLTSVIDANVGSILGIGFPVWTGGVLQYVNSYPGGLPGFVTRAEELAVTYGDRFTPPASLVAKAAAGESYA